MSCLVDLVYKSIKSYTLKNMANMVEDKNTDIIRDVPVYVSINRKINYNARYFVMENHEGERIVVDRCDYMRKYKKMARGWVNYTQYNGLVYYKHITLTQAKESYKPNILNNFLISYGVIMVNFLTFGLQRYKRSV